MGVKMSMVKEFTPLISLLLTFGSLIFLYGQSYLTTKNNSKANEKLEIKVDQLLEIVHEGNVDLNIVKTDVKSIKYNQQKMDERVSFLERQK